MHNLFAKRLRSLRAELGLSQEKVADHCMVSQSAVSDWEIGKTSPAVPELASLCHLFKVSADYLAGLTDHPQGLPPDSHLVDLEVVDAIERAATLEDLEPFRDLNPTQVLWGIRIPRRARIVNPREFERMDRRVDPILKRLLQGKKR